MQKLLFPLRLIVAVILAIISVIIKIIGPFAGFITGVLGRIGLVICVMVDLGAAIITFLWILGTEPATGSLVLFIWIFAFLLSSVCFGSIVFGENASDLGEKLWDVAKKLLGKGNSSYNVHHPDAEYTMSQNYDTPIPSDDAEEIYKFKKLLDMGAISQEEFEARKQQILNR